ncbi:MAG: hypothetical protein ACOC46_03140, partial [Pirellulales bacterium]
MPLSPRQLRSPMRFVGVLAVLVLAVAARLAAIALVPGALRDDVDGYLLLADNLASTGVYGVGEEPTAYRPPLYPLVLAPFTRLPDPADRIAIGLLHLLLGAGTVMLTYWLAQSQLARRHGWASQPSHPTSNSATTTCRTLTHG